MPLRTGAFQPLTSPTVESGIGAVVSLLSYWTVDSTSVAKRIIALRVAWRPPVVLV